MHITTEAMNMVNITVYITVTKRIIFIIYCIKNLKFTLKKLLATLA